MKFWKYYEEDIDQKLHLSVERVIEIFPNLQELVLNWYCDDDSDELIQYDKLFTLLSNSSISKFDLNPVKKMRGFTLYSKECLIYLKNRDTNRIQWYQLSNAKFNYDWNQWSTKYYQLSNGIIALKSFLSFSFEIVKEVTPHRRQRDLIEYFVNNEKSATQWLFISAWNSKVGNQSFSL